jgi:hypothetical protein
VNKAAQSIATLDTSLAPRLRRHDRWTYPAGGGGQRSMWPVTVVVLRNTSSKPSVNFWSGSRIRKQNDSRRSARVHVSCRAGWVTHGAVGFGVQPAMCTRRLPNSMKKAKAPQFADDASIAPPWVVSRETQDQRADLPTNRRAAGSPRTSIASQPSANASVAASPASR